MLLGVGLPLPKTLLVHGFVNVGGAKMSKTVGNVVDPMEIIKDYGVDAFRYYFSRHIPTKDDGDFTWEKFEKAYNKPWRGRLNASYLMGATVRFLARLRGIDEERMCSLLAVSNNTVYGMW